jgi:hypothetical protein
MARIINGQYTDNGITYDAKTGQPASPAGTAGGFGNLVPNPGYVAPSPSNAGQPGYDTYGKPIGTAFAISVL